MLQWIKWLYPGLKIKRWLFLMLIALFFISVGVVILARESLSSFFNEIFLFINQIIYSKDDNDLITFIGIAVALYGVLLGSLSVKGLVRSLQTIFGSGEKGFIDIVFMKRRLINGVNITVIGGGTGLGILLRGIKEITFNCTAIVPATDDGGSSGRLREEFAIIPPGDLRNCITALADTEPLMAKLMQYRFKEGTSLAGHSFGNLFITAMADVVGDMEKGLNATSKVLKVRGSVMPSTLQEDALLKARMDDGSYVVGETSITASDKKIEELFIEPENPAAPKSAVEAISNAEVLIVGPGSLYTSIIANFLVPEIKEAAIKSKAIKIYVCNVMTQPGETDDYTAKDHLQAICDYLGEDFFDYIIVNKEKVSEEILSNYALRGAYPIKADLEDFADMDINVIEANLISAENLVRHEPIKLAKVIIGLIYRLHLNGRGLKLLDYYFVKEKMRKLQKVLGGD